MGFRAEAPASNLGYNRVGDWPTSKGAGPAMPMSPQASPGQTGGMSIGDWHPTVMWMLGFVIVELVAFHLLSSILNI